MTDAHQRFSAQTRQSGELARPEGRRRNLESGRLSVVLGADPACVLEHEAALDDRSVGGFIRKIVMKWFLAERGWDAAALAVRAAELRAAKSAQSGDEASPASGTPQPV